jgi:hypothetical protein
VTVIVPVNAEVLDGLSEDEVAAFAVLAKYGKDVIELLDRRAKYIKELSGWRVTMTINYTIEPLDTGLLRPQDEGEGRIYHA